MCRISIGLGFTAILSACSSTTFMKYEGEQARWPISQAALVETQGYEVPVISGWPSRPYEIVGFLEGSVTRGSGQFQGGDGYAAIGYLIGRGIRSATKADNPLAGIASEAKKQGADAVVVVRSSREFAGIWSHQSSYTTPTQIFGTATTIGSGPMATTTVSLHGGDSRTESWGSSEPRYTYSFTAIAIKYVEKFPEELFLVAGEKLRESGLISTFYSKYPNLVGREHLVGAVSAWIIAPKGEDWMQTLDTLAAKTQDAIKQESAESVTGTWFGYMTQTTVREDGVRSTFSDNVQITLTQSGEQVLGNGTLASGQSISLQANRNEGKLSGSLINTTYGLKSSFSCVVSDSQMTGDFSGEGTGRSFTGVFSLYR